MSDTPTPTMPAMPNATGGAPVGPVSGVPTAPAIDAPEFYKTARTLGRSPLGIIALFIVLIYSVAGIVAAAEARIPQPLVWFIALFPVIVLGVFTWLLICHHWKLYAPGDFNDQNNWMQLQPGFADLKRTLTVLQNAAAKGGALPEQLDALAKLDRMMTHLEERSGIRLQPNEWSTTPNKPERESQVRRAEYGHEVGRAPQGVKRLRMRGKGKRTDPEDPNKGLYGGRASVDGWLLEVVDNRIRRMDDSGWFQFELRVRRTLEAEPFEGYVEFHLHDSFKEPVQRVKLVDGQASLPVISYGSFTVGAILPDGRTKLELDLASPTIRSSTTFKER